MKYTLKKSREQTFERSDTIYVVQKFENIWSTTEKRKG